MIDSDVDVVETTESPFDAFVGFRVCGAGAYATYLWVDFLLSRELLVRILLNNIHSVVKVVGFFPLEIGLNHFDRSVVERLCLIKRGAT